MDAADTAHCGKPVRALRHLRGCSVCGRLFTGIDGTLRELDVPSGVVLRLVSADDPTGAGYRAVANVTAAVAHLEWAWRARWPRQMMSSFLAASFLTLWAGFAMVMLLGLFEGALHGSRIGLWVVASIVFAVAVVLGYVAAALDTNRTRLVVSARHVERTDGPLPWGWRAALRTERSAGDTVRCVAVQRNDVRNLGASLPAPTVHQVEMVRADGSVVVLIEQIRTAERAEVIRQRVQDVLGAIE